MRQFLPLLFLPLALSGCVAAAVTAGTETGVALAEERSLGDKMDDSTIYADISNRYAQEPGKLYLKVTVRVRHQRVMLTGIVQTQSTAERAVSLAWQAKGVKEVINELIIGEDNSYGDATNDYAVKKNVESRLLITKDVWVINYSIDVVNGTVYLLGKTADRAEFNRVMNVVRGTKGVKKVVSHLQIKSEMPENGTVPPAGVSSSSTTVPAASYNSPSFENTPIYGSGGATDGTISTDSVSSKPLAPAGGGY